MADKILYPHTSAGSDLYMIVFLGDTVYNGATFETLADANWANYDIGLNELGTISQLYSGTFPNVAAGIYDIIIYEVGGTAPEVGDERQAVLSSISWDGSDIIAAVTINTAVSSLNDIDASDVQSAMTSQGYTTGRAPNLDNLDQTLSTTESNIRGADSDDLKDISDQIDLISGTAGPGGDQVTLTLLEDDAVTPIAQASVWITTDQNGTNTIAGSLSTNSLGQVTFLLDDGLQYYRWARKDGVQFNNPRAFIADAD